MTRFPLSLDARVLERVIDEVPVPAYVVGRHGRFRWLNQAAVELVGPLVGQPFAHAVAPEHVNSARNGFARKLMGQTTSDVPLKLIDRERRRISVRIASVPIWVEDQIDGLFGLAFRAISPPRGVVQSSWATEAEHELTPRQFEVLGLLAEGLGTRAIAERLGVAEETARNHLRGLFRELKVHSRLEAVVRGYRLGLLPRDAPD
jgi:DNA-binding CsgD family transcriptional regulator